MTTTNETTTATTLAERARAERDRHRALVQEAAERQVAERAERLVSDATDAFTIRFGNNVPEIQWRILDLDPSEDPTAETTVDGLRFRYRHDYRDGSVYLVTDCEVCGADVRRAAIDHPYRGISSFTNPVVQLADLLDPIDGPESADRWWCATCSQRAYEQEQERHREEIDQERAEGDAPGTPIRQRPVEELLRLAQDYADNSLSGEGAAANAFSSIAYSLLALARRGEVE